MSTRAAGFANRSAAIDPKRDILSAICLSGAFIKHGRAVTRPSLVAALAIDMVRSESIYFGQALRRRSQ